MQLTWIYLTQKLKNSSECVRLLAVILTVSVLTFIMALPLLTGSCRLSVMMVTGGSLTLNPNRPFALSPHEICGGKLYIPEQKQENPIL